MKSLALWALASLIPAQGPSEDEARKTADTVDRAIGQMQVDLRRASESASAGLGLSDVSGFEQRLADAEVQMLVEDYWRAAVFLLDVVERESNRSHPRYDDAVFQLAEAFRFSRNFGSAERYYQQLLYRARGERLTEVVEGLLDIANKTQDLTGVDQYIARLREAGGLAGPEVDYLHGKTLFAQGDPPGLNRALRLFQGIPANTEVGAKASYYAGVTLVRQRDLSGAIQQFRRTVSIVGEGPLRDLTQLSLGRLLQEEGFIEESAAAYAEIGESSPHFPDMLFEVAWAHVKEANEAEDAESERASLQEALLSTELLMATAPGPQLFPQARLLQGNLQIRLGAPETAYETFESVVGRYASSKEQLERFVRSREDTQAFFDEIVERELEGEDPRSSGLPELAVEYVLEEDGMKRVLLVERDLAEAQKDLAESRELIAMLEVAMSGEQRFRMFPSLSALRDQMLSIHNRWLSSELKLVEVEFEAVRPLLAGADGARVDEAQAEVRRLADDIRALPADVRAVAGARTALNGAYQQASLQAYRLTYRVSSMRAELQAVRRWLAENRSTLGEQAQETVEERIEKSRSTIAGLEANLERLLAEIRRASVQAGSDAGASRGRRLADDFVAARDRLLLALQPGRNAAATGMVGLLSRFDQQRRTLAGLRQELSTLENRVQVRIDGQLASLRQQLTAESARVEEESAQYATLEANSQRVLGPVSRRTLGAVQNKFEALVLEADVGLIDVAWARKQEETQKVTKLINELQERTASLESEFADVLEP
ncbi:MAG: tetratricopeptide repeat protein [Myxococcota bacterium]